MARPGQPGAVSSWKSLYRNDDAVRAHRETPHFKSYLARIADLADRLTVVGHPLDVA